MIRTLRQTDHSTYTYGPPGVDDLLDACRMYDGPPTSLVEYKYPPGLPWSRYMTQIVAHRDYWDSIPVPLFLRGTWQRPSRSDRDRDVIYSDTLWVWGDPETAKRWWPEGHFTGDDFADMLQERLSQYDYTADAEYAHSLLERMEP